MAEGSEGAPSSNAFSGWPQGKGGSGDGGTSEAMPPADVLAQREVHQAQPFASTGWLDKQGSALYPWCAAVLVSPRVVLTGAACAQRDISELRFGVGTPGGIGVAVVDSFPLSGDSRVAALLLAEGVEGVEPADLVLPTEEEEGVPVTGVSMRFAERGQASGRWVWPGVLRTEDALQVEVASPHPGPNGVIGEGNEPSCHGDNGAGVYTDAGLLAGIVVAASGSGICADRFTLSPLAARGLVEEALEGFAASRGALPPSVSPE